MATAKEDLEDLITCEICYNRFTDPRSLPCVHVFCLKCIQGIHRTASNNPKNKLKNNEFRCPKCQAVSVLPGNSTNNLPKFFHAGYLSDIVENLSQKHYICGVCTEVHQKITRYCFTCVKVLCKSCHTHRRYNSHVCVEITAGNLKAVTCNIHTELIEAFCTNCCVTVCSQCMLQTHEGHDIHDFIIRQQVADDLAHEVSAKEASCKKQLRRVEDIQRDFYAHITDLHGKITSHTDKLIAQILEQDKALHAELDRHREATNRELEKTKKILKDSDDILALAKTQMAHLTRPIPAIPPLGLHNVDELLAIVRHSLPTIKEYRPVYTNYQFVPQSSSISVGTVTEAGGVLDDKKDKKSLLSLERTSDRPRDTVAEVPRSATAAKLSPQLISQIEAGGLVQDIAWTPDRRLLVAADLKLKFYTHGYEKPLPPALSGMEGPVWSVAVHARTQSVAVIAGSGHHLDVNTLGAARRQTRHHKLPGLWCCRVRFTDAGDLLIGGGQKTLIKYNIQDLSKQWQRDTKHRTENIAVSRDKIIICGDNQLSILSEDGQWLSSFPAPSDTHRLVRPRGISSDSSGNVYVADDKKKAVIMFRPDGSYLRNLVKVKEGFTFIELYNTEFMAVGNESSLGRSVNGMLYQL